MPFLHFCSLPGWELFLSWDFFASHYLSSIIWLTCFKRNSVSICVNTNESNLVLEDLESSRVPFWWECNFFLNDFFQHPVFLSYPLCPNREMLLREMPFRAVPSRNFSLPGGCGKGHWVQGRQYPGMFWPQGFDVHSPSKQAQGGVRWWGPRGSFLLWYLNRRSSSPRAGCHGSRPPESHTQGSVHIVERLRRPRLESQACGHLAQWPWTSHHTFGGISFPRCLKKGLDQVGPRFILVLTEVLNGSNKQSWWCYLAKKLICILIAAFWKLSF